jgi:hypothetical protein
MSYVRRSSMKEYVPVEDPSLPLDPSRENKDTDDTEGEEGEDDPKSSVSGMSRVEESSLGLGLIISTITRSGMLDRTYPRTVGVWEVVLGSTVVTVMGLTSSTGGTDGDG